MIEKKVLFRKVTEHIKLQKLATQKETYEKLGLTSGQFHGMRRGVSTPSDEIFSKIEEVFPGILEKVKSEMGTAEDPGEEYFTAREELLELRVKCQFQDQILEMQKKQMDLMEKVMYEMEERMQVMHKRMKEMEEGNE